MLPQFQVSFSEFQPPNNKFSFRSISKNRILKKPFFFFLFIEFGRHYSRYLRLVIKIYLFVPKCIRNLITFIHLFGLCPNTSIALSVTCRKKTYLDGSKDIDQQWSMSRCFGSHRTRKTKISFDPWKTNLSKLAKSLLTCTTK